MRRRLPIAPPDIELGATDKLESGVLLVHEVLTVLEPHLRAPADDFRRRTVDANRLAPAVDDDQVPRTRDDGRQHGQSDFEAGDEVAVKRVHEDVGAGMDLRDPRVGPGDIPGPEAATGDETIAREIRQTGLHY